MLGWHYQVIKHSDYYAVHEYYPNKDRGDGWTENPVAITGESVEEIRWMLERILADIETRGVKNYG
jgi:hypothetical protein